MVPRPAAAASLRKQLAIQLLRPHSWSSEWDVPGWCPGSRLQHPSRGCWYALRWLKGEDHGSAHSSLPSSHTHSTVSSLFLYSIFFSSSLPPQFRALPTWMTATASQWVVPISVHPPLIQSLVGNQHCLSRRQNGPTSTLPTALQHLLTSPSSRSLKSWSSICLGQLYLSNTKFNKAQRVKKEENCISGLFWKRATPTTPQWEITKY